MGDLESLSRLPEDAGFTVFDQYDIDGLSHKWTGPTSIVGRALLRNVTRAAF